MQTDTPSPNSFDTGRTVPSRLDRDNARQRSKTFGNPTAATPNLQLWQMVYERGRSPSLRAPEGRSNPGAAWIERWIGSPSLAMTRFIVLAMRSAPESSSRDENFSALRPDLRQRMPAVVAGSLTISASSHDVRRKKKRKRNAERRGSVPTASLDAARALQSALAFRRSTTALCQWDYSSQGSTWARLRDTKAKRGRSPASPCGTSSDAPRAPVIVPAG
jgi:hypothetical protein